MTPAVHAAAPHYNAAWLFPAPIMTYCVAARLNAGLVFLSDSRTNAGWTRSASTAR